MCYYFLNIPNLKTFSPYTSNKATKISNIRYSISKILDTRQRKKLLILAKYFIYKDDSLPFENILSFALCYNYKCHGLG